MFLGNVGDITNTLCRGYIMHFIIKEMNGLPYLLKVKSHREPGKQTPRNTKIYIGSLEKIEKAINRWREKNEYQDD